VTIAPIILKHYPDLDDAKREVVAHLDGPLLVVAGPGSEHTMEHGHAGGIARAYHAYETALFASNRTDFAHLQSIVHGLLLPLPSITGTVEGTVTDYNAGYGRRLASGSVGGDGGKKNAWSLIDLIDLVVDHHSHDG